MPHGYEINELAKEESWRLFRIIGELVEGFDKLTGIEPAVTIYGSARLKQDDELYAQTVEIARRLGEGALRKLPPVGELPDPLRPAVS